MPFTFSHPAIVLPFRTIWKRYFSLTALIIGSMSPDFEYFLRLKVRSDYSHTILGVFWFDVPLAIVLCFIFHLLVKKALFQNSPHFLQIRFNNFIDFNFTSYFKRHYLIVVFSLILGAFSHLFWDAFTHHNGFFVEQLPILKAQITDYSIPIFKILQHFSTLIGGIAILFWIYKLPKNAIHTYSISIRYWLSLLGCFSLLLGIRIWYMIFFHIGDFIVSAIALMMLSLLLLGFFYRKTYKSDE